MLSPQEKETIPRTGCLGLLLNFLPPKLQAQIFYELSLRFQAFQQGGGQALVVEGGIDYGNPANVEQTAAPESIPDALIDTFVSTEYLRREFGGWGHMRSFAHVPENERILIRWKLFQMISIFFNRGMRTDHMLSKSEAHELAEFLTIKESQVERIKQLIWEALYFKDTRRLEAKIDAQQVVTTIDVVGGPGSIPTVILHGVITRLRDEYPEIIGRVEDSRDAVLVLGADHDMTGWAQQLSIDPRWKGVLAGHPDRPGSDVRDGSFENTAGLVIVSQDPRFEITDAEVTQLAAQMRSHTDTGADGVPMSTHIVVIRIHDRFVQDRDDVTESRMTRNDGIARRHIRVALGLEDRTGFANFLHSDEVESLEARDYDLLRRIALDDSDVIQAFSTARSWLIGAQAEGQYRDVDPMKITDVLVRFALFALMRGHGVSDEAIGHLPDFSSQTAMLQRLIKMAGCVGPNGELVAGWADVVFADKPKYAGIEMFRRRFIGMLGDLAVPAEELNLEVVGHGTDHLVEYVLHPSLVRMLAFLRDSGFVANAELEFATRPEGVWAYVCTSCGCIREDIQGQPELTAVGLRLPQPDHNCPHCGGDKIGVHYHDVDQKRPTVLDNVGRRSGD